MENESHYTASQNFLNSLLEGNRQACSSIVKNYLAENRSFHDLYEKVIKVALYEVGRLWETNKISVADEHMATAITEGIMNELYPQLIPEKYINKKVVLACVDNEEHQVGIKMVADIFEMNGWESFFLGAGFPTAELIKYIEKVKPQVLALSLSVYFNYKNFKNMVLALRDQFPDLPFLVGGQAFNHISEDAFSEFDGIKFISELSELENFITNLNE